MNMRIARIEYTLKYYPSQKCWVAKYKTDSGWKNKTCPRSIGPEQELEARDYLDKVLGGVDLALVKSVKVVKSVRKLADMWLRLREKDAGTKPNTYRGFQNDLKNHILNHTIADLDIETQLLVNPVRDWATGLSGAYSSRLSYIGTLKALIKDSINEGWLDPDLVNVCEKEPIKKLVKNFKKINESDHITIAIEISFCREILTKLNPKVDDIRRLKYLVALTAGLRHGEIQALTFGDIKQKDGFGYLDVQKQLYKRGNAPALRYNDLLASGLGKSDMAGHKQAIVSNPKLESNREAPIHPLLAVALDWWIKVGYFAHTGLKPAPELPIFGRSNVSLRADSQAGDFAEAHDDAAIFRLDLERLGLPLEFGTSGIEFDFHSLRHSFSSALEAAGVEESKIGILLGHKATSVTRKNYIAKNLEVFSKIVRLLPFNAVLLGGQTLTSNS